MLSSIRQVTLHGVESKTKKNIQGCIFEVDKKHAKNVRCTGNDTNHNPLPIEVTKATVASKNSG